MLVYFYPKADTPGCTTQSCALRDIAGDIGDTAIVGISPDASAKQKKFDDKYSLGFPLLADTEHTVAEAFGVWGEKKNYGRTYMGIIRSAFLVDEKGKVEQAWYKVSPKDTPTNLLEGPRRRERPAGAGRGPPAPAAVPARSTRSSSSRIGEGPEGCGTSPATRTSSPATSRAVPPCPGC